MVKFGPVYTDSVLSPMVDLIYPVQSYVANVPGVDKLLSRLESLAKISTFVANVGNELYDVDYDPWSAVNNFHCSDFERRRHASKTAKESSSGSNSESPR